MDLEGLVDLVGLGDLMDLVGLEDLVGYCVVLWEYQANELVDLVDRVHSDLLDSL